MKTIPIRHINTTQKEPELTDSFSIRDVESFLDGNDMVQELHRHDFFYILALKKGTGIHEIDFTSYEICDHSVFFMRPGQVHQLSLKAGSTGYLMQFSIDFYFPHDKTSGQLLRKAGTINHHLFSAGKFQKLFGTFEYIFQEYVDKEERYQEVIKANMGVFFIELIRQNNGPSDSVGSYVQEQLERFLELLETQVFNHLQVSQYAAMLNLSTYQLNAVTKATLGKTPLELITGYSILEAKRCLLATSNQINQIAYRLGYDDVSYFIRFFKKHTGHSPEAFRQNFK